MSNSHLGVTPPPPLPQLWSHALEFDPSEDELPPSTATNIPSTSVVPPLAAPTAASTAAFDSKIADAIVALFAHMYVIHTDLVERIGQVHERVDLIVEHQEHDIKVMRDTLSALSRQHAEFYHCSQ